MTQPFKKRRERYFVEKAAEHLGEVWELGPDREHPDFIVSEGARQFGLEVCEIFTGRQNRAGSHMKRGESETLQTMNALRREYENAVNIPLSVRFLGDLRAENLTKIIPALVAKDLTTKPVGHRVVINVGSIDRGTRLRVHVTRAFVADWVSVDNRVGWVDRHPIKRIVNAIEKKSKELPRYREIAGSDIRLLIVADRTHNSGKLMLMEQARLDVQGFQAVYFFSYPESVITFDGNAAGVRATDLETQAKA